MAKPLTPQDAYVLINALVREATGQNTITASDTSSFVSAGETLMSVGKENIMNALSLVIGRTLIATRPYRATLRLLDRDTGVYSQRLRKISFYAKDALQSGWFNTQLANGTNFAEGYTSGDNGGASVKSQWEQHQAMPLEFNFVTGPNTWQDCITLYEDKLEQAFRDEASFNAFIAGILTEHANDIESQKEAWNRMALVSAIAARYYYTVNLSQIRDGAINMTTAFNNRFGTTYSTAQLQTTYFAEFAKFAVAFIQELSDHMTERGTAYHLPMTKTVGGVSYSILRHTPKEKQRLMLYAPLLRYAQTEVLSGLFNPQYLNIENYEPVSFWQSNYDETVRPSINMTVPYYDTVSGEQKATPTAVQIDYVVGVLFDEDAVGTSFGMERATTSGLEARKGYRNSWLTFSKGAVNDATENMIVLYMAD